MNGTLEYIDSYFNEEMPPQEKLIFESRCESDPAFAEEVAFYVSARAGVRAELHQQKRKAFGELYIQLSAKKGSTQGMLKKMLPYISAAAACLVIFLGWQLFFTAASAQKLADTYIQKNMAELSIPMGNTTDSLQLGTQAFKAKNYSGAEKIFRALSVQPATRAEAQKYLGTLYLLTKRYDEALTEFEALAGDTALYANPGLFYKAVTLLKRNAEGDEQQARKILEEVSARNLPGSREAKIWIDKL